MPLYRHIDVAAGVFQDPLIRPEHVDDYELGGSWHVENASISAKVRENRCG